MTAENNFKKSQQNKYSININTWASAGHTLTNLRHCTKLSVVTEEGCNSFTGLFQTNLRENTFGNYEPFHLLKICACVHLLHLNAFSQVLFLSGINTVFVTAGTNFFR